MKCLNCGCENTNYVCVKCQKEEIWSNVFSQLYYYNSDKCENQFVNEFVNSLDAPEKAKDIILSIIELFENEEDRSYYYCRYAKIANLDKFEQLAINYVNMQQEWTKRKQIILRMLLNWYGLDDFETPDYWYQIIEDTENLYCELYYMAADYRSKVGDYDKSEQLLKKIEEYCKNEQYDKFFTSKENVLKNVEKTAGLLVRYKTIKPYWPQTEERQKKIMAIYERKGISVQPVLSKSKKVNEKDFKMPEEYMGEKLDNYSVFWCAECFSIKGAKDIYEIAAVRVRNNKKVDSFRKLIKPWKAGTEAKKKAAKEIGITVEELNKQENVDIVMKEFFDFVGDDVLISTDAMGRQRDYISRAARYSGFTTIKNELIDILYYAEDVNDRYEGKNNSREYILEDLKIREGKNSLTKAEANHKIYQKLKKMES